MASVKVRIVSSSGSPGRSVSPCCTCLAGQPCGDGGAAAWGGASSKLFT